MSLPRRSRAVGTAWAALLLIAGLAVAAMWTGAVGPDMQVRSVASETIAGPHQEVLEVRNGRRWAVTVTDVGLAVPGLRRVSVQLVSPAGEPRRFRATRLAQGESVDVLITFREVPCNSKASVAGGYTVTARTALGLTRTMHVERGDLVVRRGREPYRYSDGPIARSDVRHRCGFYD